MISIIPFIRILALAVMFYFASAGSPAKAADVTFLKAAEANLAAEAAAQAWAKVPEILARIVPPTFPAHDFVISSYGAKADGEADCTEAFRQAIAACHQAGMVEVDDADLRLMATAFSPRPLWERGGGEGAGDS